MKKGEMERKFQEILNRRKERLKNSKDKGNEGVALMNYGEICGITDSMYAIGLIDWTQRDYIKNEAFAVYSGKEPADEAC